MTSSLVSGLGAIIMAFITFLTSVIGIIQNRPNDSVVQGFEAKEVNVMRIMSFNIRCANVGSDTWEDRIDIVSQTMLDSEADSIGVQ